MKTGTIVVEMARLSDEEENALKALHAEAHLNMCSALAQMRNHHLAKTHALAAVKTLLRGHLLPCSYAVPDDRAIEVLWNMVKPVPPARELGARGPLLVTAYRSLGMQEKLLGENGLPALETARKLKAKLTTSEDYGAGYTSQLHSLDISCGSPRKLPAGGGDCSEIAKISARGYTARMHWNATNSPERSQRPTTSASDSMADLSFDDVPQKRPQTAPDGTA